MTNEVLLWGIFGVFAFMGVLYWAMWYFINPIASAEVDAMWGNYMHDSYTGNRRRLYLWKHARETQMWELARERQRERLNG